MEELIGWVREHGYVAEIAALAPVVGLCARDGDATAQEILDRAGSDLASLTKSVLRQLGMIDAECEIVLSGGTLRHEPLVVESLERELARSAPMARAIWPRHESALGAALLAIIAREDRCSQS
jgi:N-acetylglucosamine kinase-like BadF-type ATPase